MCQGFGLNQVPKCSWHSFFVLFFLSACSCSLCFLCSVVLFLSVPSLSIRLSRLSHLSLFALHSCLQPPPHRAFWPTLLSHSVLSSVSICPLVSNASARRPLVVLSICLSIYLSMYIYLSIYLSLFLWCFLLFPSGISTILLDASAQTIPKNEPNGCKFCSKLEMNPQKPRMTLTQPGNQQRSVKTLQICQLEPKNSENCQE